VLVEETINAKGLAFVMHGLGGFMVQPQVQAMADAFLQNNYTTIRFDTTSTLGESDGKYEDATTTNYYEDLEDVIAWAKTQNWYEEPFTLAGQSLGGICVGLYAEKFSNEVKGLILVNSTVSGEKSIAGKDQAEIKKWKETGWETTVSISKPGVIKRLPWSHMEDRLKYDLLPLAHKLTMQVLLISGELDNSERPEDQKDLFDKIPGQKKFVIIPGAPHTIRDPAHLDSLRSALDSWIKTL